MAAARFFVATLKPGMIRLAAPEGRHATRSRRLSVGDAVMLFDGQGHEAPGRIAAARDELEVQVGPVCARARRRPALTLAVALPKGPRQDLLIEKLTELGTAAIQPLRTERSIGSVSDHKRRKWRQTTIEAAKQSGQCWLPVLHPPRSLPEVLAEVSTFDRVLAAVSPGDAQRTPRRLADMRGELMPLGRILAFVGPEGGWTEDEAISLVAAGAEPINLGPNILRVETAAIALAAIVHSLSG